jgi:hypothetical protein
MVEKTQNSKTFSHEHMGWLIESRAKNQRAALLLHQLLTTHFETIKNDKHYSIKAQALLGTCFSLWRAAFLADITGGGIEVALGDAREFLEKMLEDNAITYPQDKASRGWTFKYYVASAAASINVLRDDYWPKMEVSRKGDGKTHHWDFLQEFLDLALDNFKNELEGNAH